MEKPIKELVNDLEQGLCSSTLKEVLDNITSFTGFESRNCLRRNQTTGVGNKFYDAEDFVQKNVELCFDEIKASLIPWYQFVTKQVQVCLEFVPAPNQFHFLTL